jgi:hypothetical protein
MKTLALILIAVVLPATSVSAQISTSLQQNTASGIDTIVRVTTAFRTTVMITELQMVPDAKAQEAARRALYGMAESECAALSEIFKAECRLSSVSIANPVMPANVPASNILTASAVYELKPSGSVAGR